MFWRKAAPMPSAPSTPVERQLTAANLFTTDGKLVMSISTTTEQPFFCDVSEGYYLDVAVSNSSERFVRFLPRGEIKIFPFEDGVELINDDVRPLEGA